MDPETSFLAGLIELQYGQPVQESLRALAPKVPWALGWPDNNKSFWNAEAFMWGHKIEKQTRDLIAGELGFLQGGRNVDIGCGAYSYLPSVGFDLSEKMLQFNEQCYDKVWGTVEETLPFLDSCFDSATAVFLFNYVVKYEFLLTEIFRILKPGGRLAVVLSSHSVNEWQRQKEVTVLSAGEWDNLLQAAGFLVHFYEKEGLWFFVAHSAVKSS